MIELPTIPGDAKYALEQAERDLMRRCPDDNRGDAQRAMVQELAPMLALSRFMRTRRWQR
jgi:hypothetical protein